MATECRAPKLGASGRTQSGGRSRSPRTNQVQTSTEGGETPTPHVTGTTAQPSDATETTHPNDPLQYLLPDSAEEGVARVTETRVKDQGSRLQLIRVEVSGVPLDRVVDTGADITRIGAEAFKTVAKLRQRDFKRPDKTPWTYDQKTFRIDGRIDVDITFQESTMRTPVYIKMDTKEQLLLSEGVCRQLGIVTYHREVVPGKGEAGGGGVVQGGERCRSESCW